MEKSEAQLRQEEEIRRIKEERGWDTKEYQKALEKVSRSPKIFKIMSVVLAVAVSVVAILMKDDITSFIGSIFRSNEPEKIEQKDLQKQMSDFNECLKDIEIPEIDEPNFYEDLISKYEETISCYVTHPDVSNQSEKTTLEQELEAIKIAASQNVSEEEKQQVILESNTKYQEAITRIDKEYQEKLVEIDAESAKNDAETKSWLDNYDKERAEQKTQYEKERAEREAREEATKKQQEAEARAKKEKCDNALERYGKDDNEAAIMAKNDAYILGLYQKWQEYDREATEYENSGTVITYAQCQLFYVRGRGCPAYSRDAANSYKEKYDSALSEKVASYVNLRKSACGY